MTPDPYAPPASVPRSEAETQAHRDATVALVLAVLAFVVCAPVLAPVALWKAARARHVVRSWPSAVAIGVAVASLFVSAAFWFLALWQYLAPG